MPKSPENYAALENAVNRLASESMLATAGRDDGLVPAYSLVGELCELCSGQPALREPLTTLLAALEKCLDSAQPFSVELLARLRTTVEWLGSAIDAVRNDTTLPPAPGAAAPGTSPAGAPGDNPAAPKAESRDVLMTFQLEDNQELLSEFHAEVVDHLQQIEAALLSLDHEPDNPEALNSIFRSFHTIKGNAGFLGLVPMHTLAHEVESLLDLARNHKLRLNSVIITEVLRSRDALQALTQQVGVALEQGRLPGEIIPVSHLMAAVKRLAVPDGAMPEPAPVEALVVPPPAPVGAAAPVPEPVVPVAAIAPVVPFVAEPAPAEAAAEAAALAAAGNSAAKIAAGAEKAAAAGQTVRVSTEKLDSLMDVVGELVIVQSQIMESARSIGMESGSPLQRNVTHLTRLTKELQHTSMALRMIPIKPTFQKMERLARDLARSCVKKVAFVTSGDETELDRTVVEEIADPLVHMVRNAMDHGLEPADVRLAAGKPETGTVHLSAYHQGSNIVIELRDDGRGINPDVIYRKAVEKGVIAPNATLSREEIFALIFAPGFSTAEKVTAVSGRGVGMDVVKRNIMKLRGKIEINSEVGKGSVFKIKLPLTMAIIDGLVVRVGQDRFILPATSVQMALRPARDTISTIQGTGEVMELRGRILPLHRLHRRFNITADIENPWEGIVVIIEHSGRTSALLVDEMVSKQEVVIKSLGSFMQGLPGVSGGAILGDGNIALILDPASILQVA
ncbi:Chemotaxis protein CheA [Lacunisphaera limnophila]|uniref:histidine kinase n=1 Tax=Lacunisphaera limnophila TaxID=1838286 RepID=A0A1D8AW60_9BACT|nr:chemotaxis protein CheA [Lacunisphaera limnophila]AOS45095.1 Chemotaxis protein CheA [Lacunisphaera limnophila]